MLLSMYNDEDDDDDEMDDAPAEDGAGVLEFGGSGMVDGDRGEVELREAADRVGDTGFLVGVDGGGGLGGVGESGEEVVVEERSGGRRTVGKMAIVDYAHDEVAVSPRVEESTIEGKDYDVVHEVSQSANGDSQEKSAVETVQVLSPNDQAIPLSSEDMNLLPQEAGNLISTDSNAAEGDDTARTPGAIDPLDKFLPSPPATLCSRELQDKVRKFLKYKKAGKSFNAEVRNRKDYRNPDFLLHAVTYQGIDQVGSCLSKDVFDPHGYDLSDYYDQIEADMKREQERKRSQQIDLVSGGAQAAAAAALQKVNMSLTGDGLRAVDTALRDGRQKKSKWDKVDDDRKTPLPPVGKDSLSSVAAHAAILSAANAGAGYTAFAQQRRREAEERRSDDRKPDKRSNVVTARQLYKFRAMSCFLIQAWVQNYCPGTPQDSDMVCVSKKSNGNLDFNFQSKLMGCFQRGSFPKGCKHYGIMSDRR
ncbi:hypothetical protein MLD38_019290 [Melastoma candidum]|uniref:Uncharacterized protein n=1 Tax=Melastoma candidum TaxID=119954 RepID=A0ACB9QWJ1_9MYRT|nr:hypothetical protein MLD38_019290 [Melastoma candidum]